MYDRELALEILTQIYDSTRTILKRFAPVKSVEDFTGPEETNYRPALAFKGLI